LIRDALAVGARTPQTQVINEDLIPQLCQISEKMTVAQAAAWITQIEELREQLIVNINRKIATDGLFMSMASV
jgi:hypothetical protein